MAKENSFDIVSECDLQEVDNAYQQALKALKQRYDLKDSGASIDFDKSKQCFDILAPSDFVCGQVIDILNTHLVRRKVDLQAVKWGNVQEAAGGNVKRSGTLVQGIEQDISKKINKDIKNEKFKVKVQIEGTKLRVSGPKRDELQAVISFLREKDYGLPLQFVNYR